MERYEHKVVLITGAGDIAGATARRLLSEGGKVALTDFSREALDQEARMLKEEGWDEDRVMTIPGDVRSLEDCQAAAAEVKEKWGRIDVLVATAGILRHFPIDELTEAQWQDVVCGPGSDIYRNQQICCRREKPIVVFELQGRETCEYLDLLRRQISAWVHCHG